MTKEQIWKENWRWIAYLITNNLLTKYIENCCNLRRAIEDSTRMNDFWWEESPEGELFWWEHWHKAKG